MEVNRVGARAAIYSVHHAVGSSETLTPDEASFDAVATTPTLDLVFASLVKEGIRLRPTVEKVVPLVPIERVLPDSSKDAIVPKLAALAGTAATL